MFDRINLINDQLVVSCVFAIVMGGQGVSNKHSRSHKCVLGYGLFKFCCLLILGSNSGFAVQKQKLWHTVKQNKKFNDLFIGQMCQSVL